MCRHSCALLPLPAVLLGGRVRQAVVVCVVSSLSNLSGLLLGSGMWAAVVLRMVCHVLLVCRVLRCLQKLLPGLRRLHGRLLHKLRGDVCQLLQGPGRVHGGLLHGMRHVRFVMLGPVQPVWRPVHGGVQGVLRRHQVRVSY